MEIRTNAHPVSRPRAKPPGFDAHARNLAAHLRDAGAFQPDEKAQQLLAVTDLQRVYRGRHARRSHPLCIHKNSQVLFLRDISVLNLKAAGRATPNPLVRFTVETMGSVGDKRNAMGQTPHLLGVMSGRWDRITLRLDRLPPMPVLVIEVIDRVDTDQYGNRVTSDKVREEVICLRRYRLRENSGREDELPVWSTAVGNLKNSTKNQMNGSVSFTYKVFKTKLQLIGKMVQRGKSFYEQLESVDARVARMIKRDEHDGYIVVLGGQASEWTHKFCEMLGEALSGGIISVKAPFGVTKLSENKSVSMRTGETPGELAKMIRSARQSKASWRYAVIDDFCQTVQETRVFEAPPPSDEDRPKDEAITGSQVLRAIAFPDSYLLAQLMSDQTAADGGHMLAGAPRAERTPAAARQRDLLRAAGEFETTGRLVRLPALQDCDVNADGVATEEEILATWVKSTVSSLRSVGLSVPVALTQEQSAKRMQSSRRLCLHNRTIRRFAPEDLGIANALAAKGGATTAAVEEEEGAVAATTRQVRAKRALKRKDAEEKLFDREAVHLFDESTDMMSGRAMRFLCERDQEDEAAHLHEAIERKRSQLRRGLLPPEPPALTSGMWTALNAATDPAAPPSEPKWVLEQRLAALNSPRAKLVPGSAEGSPRKHGRTTQMVLAGMAPRPRRRHSSPRNARKSPRKTNAGKNTPGMRLPSKPSIERQSIRPPPTRASNEADLASATEPEQRTSSLTGLRKMALRDLSPLCSTPADSFKESTPASSSRPVPPSTPRPQSARERDMQVARRRAVWASPAREMVRHHMGVGGVADSSLGVNRAPLRLWQGSRQYPSWAL